MAAALAHKTILAKMLFLRNTTQLFSEFQTLFQREEPLIHIVYTESLSLMKKALSCFMKHDVYCNLNGTELKQLDVAAPGGLKHCTEIGSGTEKEMCS